MRCSRCGSEVSSSRLSCPACHQLIHSDRLKALAAEADAAASRGEIGAAIEAWSSARELLPPGSRQYDVVRERIDELEKRRVAEARPGSPAPSARAPGPGWKKIGVGVGAAGLLLWKLKGLRSLPIKPRAYF